MRKVLFVTLFSLPFLFFFAHLFVFNFGENFHSKNFEHGFEKIGLKHEFEQAPLDLDSLFAKPFFYLGQGNQMTAFVSQDGKVVLKLFNPCRPYKAHWYKEGKLWKRYTSFKWISRERFHKKERLKKLFHRHMLAFDALREETGLKFVHLAPSEAVSHFAHLYDKEGKKHVIHLANTPFVLQEKAVLVPEHLKHLESKEEVAEALLALEQLLIKRASLGITDRIQTMGNNYGFVGSKAIQIDMGKIRLDPAIKAHPAEETERILTNFHSWVKVAIDSL